MKFILTDYQLAAADQLAKHLRRMTRDFGDGDHGALGLAAPTAAGKTVIATAVIERLFSGDDASPADPLATVLWITDDPSLNQQTRRKMLMASSSIKTGQLVSLSAAFDQATFDPGRVYFLNVQKLGRATSFVKGGTNTRQFSLWTTIGNTIRARGGHFYVIIDEAHRGAKRDTARPTIVSRIVSDDQGVLPPAPVVWGISATPERFRKAMADSSNPSRVWFDVKVRPEDVRESGLLKDKILIKHPTEAQPSDSTLTKLAVADLKTMTERWAAYSSSEGEPHVQPVLVVQVKAKASEGDLSQLLAMLREGWAELDGRAVAHSFESHTSLNLNGATVRYIAPQDIQDDSQVRAVLFKEALTTGWDCPRAEVMLSFRKGGGTEDDTYITQLIGRMVRTPLAKRISTTELLNTVALFLPYYDEASVDRVVAKLRTDDDGPPVDYEKNSVECGIDAALDPAALEILRSLPTYVVPGKVHRSQVGRLHTLAARLAGDGIDDQAITKADAHLLATLARERSRLAGALDATVVALGQIDYRVKEVSLRDGLDDARPLTTSADARNINDLLKGAARGLRDGLHKTLWGKLVDDGADPDDAKLIAAALAGEATVVTAVESAAQELVQTWLKTHSRSIAELPEVKKAAYSAIRAQARKSELVDIVLPSAITACGDDPRWERHVYVDDKGTYPAKFNGWEQAVLTAELTAGRGLVAWYRNPPGGERSIRVPFQDGEHEKPVYADFVFIHTTPDGLRPSIVDPHNYALADSFPKWRGLASYAEKHGDVYARIDAVIKDPDDHLLRLDLKDATVRAALATANGKEAILAVFKAHGGNYC